MKALSYVYATIIGVGMGMEMEIGGGDGDMLTLCMFIQNNSLGGAIAVRTAASGRLNVVGVGVIDVVEGTAIPALVHMPSILRRRPKDFSSVQDAVVWRWDQ